jgi:thiosulfate dehydrogenase
MNCQNCHLDGGTLPFANNFGKVYPTYPQFGARSNGIKTIYGRINDCMERSLNGKAMDSTTKEMRAIYAYLKWLGDDVPKGYIRAGTGLPKIKFLPVAANPSNGRKIYQLTCQSCHGINGEGQPNPDGTGYIYPPLWGNSSYNDGAGLYRTGSFAAFVKTSMPFGADYHEPKLTDEEAWDVAAFVNSQPRPHMDQSHDWKKLQSKPVDFPFGPFTDSFSELRHKYGPFADIAAMRENKNKPTHQPPVKN